MQENKTIKSRKFVFTLNNYSTTDVEHLKGLNESSKITFLCFQPEVGAEKGTPHLQGVVHFKAPTTLKHVKEVLGNNTVHIEIQKGTNKQATEYCNKLNTKNGEFYSFGKLSLDGSGKRSDLESLYTDIKSGKYTLEQIRENHLNLYFKHHSLINQLYTQYNKINVATPDVDIYQWQHNFFSLLFGTKPQKRVIYYLWSFESATGKSTTKDFISSKMDILPIETSNVRDVIHIYNNERVIWLDLPRHSRVDDYRSLLEKLSDQGLVTSTKYEGGKKVINAHIVVTGNVSPLKLIQMLPKRIFSFELNVKTNPTAKLQFKSEDDIIKQLETAVDF